MSAAQPDLRQRHRTALDVLRRFRQEHLLAFWERLDDGQRGQLLDQIEALPLQLIERLDRERGAPSGSAPQPLTTVLRDSADSPHWESLGLKLVAAGEVCCFTVAGGQGTRLGYDGPKGLFPATPCTGKPLFQLFAESILGWRRRTGASIPWFVMTSPLNHAATESFFREHSWFGLGAESVRLFMQGTIPSLDDGGKMLLSAPGEIAVNPDGHGGALRALAQSGALEEMTRRGVRHISYFQVDNPLARVIDPVFLGMHAGHPGSSAEMSSKAVAKRNVAERVGVFALIDGRTAVVEYSDLSAEQSNAMDLQGHLLFGAGSIAIHAIAVDFAKKLTAEADSFALPFHRAYKKVPFIDERGVLVEPNQPNAWKLEAFIFDALPLTGRSLVVEVRREDEFAPIKNASGDDSPQSSGAAQSAQFANWLEAAGVVIPRQCDGTPDCQIEISPLRALCAADLRGKVSGLAVERGGRVTL